MTFGQRRDPTEIKLSPSGADTAPAVTKRAVTTLPFWFRPRPAAGFTAAP